MRRIKSTENYDVVSITSEAGLSKLEQNDLLNDLKKHGFEEIRIGSTPSSKGDLPTVSACRPNRGKGLRYIDDIEDEFFLIVNLHKTGSVDGLKTALENCFEGGKK